MTEGYLRQSPLAHLGLEGRAAAERGTAGLALAERPHRGIVSVRIGAREAGAFAAFEQAFGFALPSEPNTVAGDARARALWMGPDEWWIVVPDAAPGTGAACAERLRDALGTHFVGITEVGESRTCIRLAGPAARRVLQKGCPLDLHPQAFGTGQCAQSLLAAAAVALHLVEDEKSAGDGPVIEVYVLRSVAEYLWLWLEDAGREYGVAIVEG